MDAAMVEVLQQATSQDPILKPAEQTLKQWETERRFYTALYNVFSNHSLSINVGWLLCVLKMVLINIGEKMPRSSALSEN
ncbi:hypothetical protein E2986_13571 [Frieseomelitta varia]|uniref:Uncharacterized protein n=1 Tax=Frieseomelitta varia TaxID=561572 RepID=A0A833RBC5_9HYME|nr:importin-11-like [Frieseomelitta varia]XP_043509896.1 importin-11-like [Frieseomelitta varia]XP_043509906.1 importin-11-like [Frieseomelitta varia]KAF3419829.1 hypothetical protein E2986_13571 [Frieseomelitta varia]